jgi:anti-sigma B factor antagonist
MTPMGETVWTCVEEQGALKLTGEVDYTVSEEVRAFLLEKIATGQGTLALDLAEVSYLDSSGLAILLEVRRTLLDLGRTLCIKSISPPVKKLMVLTKVDHVFDLCVEKG